MQTTKTLTNLELDVIASFKAIGLQRTVNALKAPEKVIREILVKYELIPAPKPVSNSRKCLVVYEFLVGDQAVFTAETVIVAPIPSFGAVEPGVKHWAARLAEKYNYERYGYRYRLYQAPRKNES